MIGSRECGVNLNIRARTRCRGIWTGIFPIFPHGTPACGSILALGVSGEGSIGTTLGLRLFVLTVFSFRFRNRWTLGAGLGCRAPSLAVVGVSAAGAGVSVTILPVGRCSVSGPGFSAAGAGSGVTMLPGGRCPNTGPLLSLSAV